MSHEITRTDHPEEQSIGMLLAGVLQHQVTPDTVAVAERLMAMKERDDANKARIAFAEALASLQSKTLRVVATKKVDVKSDGSCRYKFAPYEEIMRTVQPMLTAHGFSITFDTKISDDGARLKSLCTLMHSGGHAQTNEFSIRLGSKPPGSSDAQGDMSAKSYAKRGALCDALNISIDHDDDARAEGAPITEEQSLELIELVQESKSDRVKFLAYAGAETFQEISSTRFDELRAVLVKRLPK